MTYEDLAKLIAHNEHRELELKKSTGELKDGMHTACAFLNTDGGWLIFGVTPTSLKIVGQDVTDNTQREIAQQLSGLEPAVNVNIDYIDVPSGEGKKVIVIYFNGWTWGDKPYTYHGTPYYKVESTTRMMPRTMFEERLKAARPEYYAWERQEAKDINITDLNEARIKGVIRLGVERGRFVETALYDTIETTLEKLRLMRKGKLNNAAAALFTNDCYEYPQFMLRMARFQGTDKTAFIDNQRVEGNFFDLLDAGMAFFVKQLNLSGKIIGMHREEHLEVPIEALREALTNALCHRTYDNYNLTPGIAIYDDRVEIENPGTFPPEITPENIKREHISHPTNRIIADVLFKTTFLESWGSGIKRIMDACKKQNLSEPIWSDEGGFVRVVFKRPTQEEIEKLTSFDSQSKQTGKQTSKQTSKQTGKQTTAQRILFLMQTAPSLSRKEMAEQIGVSESAIYKNIEKLKKTGKIVRVGGDFGGHWQVIEQE